MDDSNEKLVWLLALKPDSPIIHKSLLPKNITDHRLLFGIVCSIKPHQNFALTLLYLKCINELISIFKETGILEAVIKHFSEIKIP